jgi:hypothetical protein
LTKGLQRYYRENNVSDKRFAKNALLRAILLAKALQTHIGGCEKKHKSADPGVKKQQKM